MQYCPSRNRKAIALLFLIAIALLYKYPLFLIPLALVAIWYFYKKREDGGAVEEFLPYHKKQYVMTSSEYAFFKVLQEVVQDRYYIVPQVALSNLVEVNDGYTWNKSWRSKIDKKSIDFVLFNKGSYTTYLAIELDDSSHLREDRIKRDEFVEKVLQKTGIKLIRIKTNSEYNSAQISQLINGD